MKGVLFSTGAGGIGKVVASTALLPAIQAQYPDMPIHVLTPHPAVYLHNPMVERVLLLGHETQLREKYEGFTWLQYEPYLHRDYLAGDKHLLHCWAQGLGLDPQCLGQPRLHLTTREKRDGEATISRMQQPCIMWQTSGGGKDPAAQAGVWRRDVEPRVAEAVIGLLGPGFGHLQVRHDTQPAIKGAVEAKGNLRQIWSMMHGCQIVVTIDSMAMHSAAALGKPCLCMWGATRPGILGYSSVMNLVREACPTPSCHRPDSYRGDTQPDGTAWMCPHGEACLDHDPVKIVETIRRMAI